MENILIYKGIKTNNLKNIDISLNKGLFYGITGPSGSGKSSLAYGTIFAISNFEWEKVTGDIKKSASFNVDYYDNIIPAISLIQDNYNTNPRSTIATLLKVDKDFRFLFSITTGKPASIFTFNNPQNACEHCSGLGIEYIVDPTQLIDSNKTIKEQPFKSWKNKYQQKVLEKFAEHSGIPLDTPFSNLNEIHKDLILYSSSDTKFRVSYTLSGKKRSREFYYEGLLLEMNKYREDKKRISSHQKITDYSTASVCSKCNGTRFNNKILNLKYFGKSIGELYQLEIEELSIFIKNAIDEENVHETKLLLNNIKNIITELVNSNLGYLNFNRSIPSLSGGELQRLRLVNILSSKITDMMYVIDEPSARLHISEYDSLLDSLFKLRDRNNTILMIEHNQYFLSKTDKIYTIGPKSGTQGGYIIDYIPENTKPYFIPRPTNSFISFTNLNENNLKNVSIKVPLENITGIYGPSGSGKSTLVKSIVKQYKHTEYISQKPLRGSKVSTIASYCGVFDDIRTLFSNELNTDSSVFNFNSEKGKCVQCNGKGSITYELDFGKTEIEVTCDECKGKRYNNSVLSYKVENYTIYDILNSTIDHLIENSFLNKHETIIKKLNLLQKLGLGYLTLFRTTDTISGGEAQRLKLTKFLGKKLKNKIFIFDEPLRGLSDNDANNILDIFTELTENLATVIFIEHNTLGLNNCDFIIEMGPGKGKYGGNVLFEGSIIEFKKSTNYKKYILEKH
ncbi:ATP-binding cassette domain-containing protein [Myroides pelagicus]|uniref:ATP-binding cassette domain-containing protein n=1 Tax=Myroides pelagicus TaxID=270914 RepID=UPI002DBF1781|nr:ATP-binding cassette domain-containing protein [Myroides pelagicus]MEC4114946.1 ATP-binding cassette domain-containing protein [Myroides pelagicus]